MSAGDAGTRSGTEPAAVGSSHPDAATSHSGDRVVNTSLFLLLALIFCGLDLWTKDRVFRQLYVAGADWQEPYWLVEGVFGLQTSFNAGALFGLGQGFSWLFAGIAIVYFGLIVAWIFLGDGWRDRTISVALGLIGAGILGNLYDRLGWGMRGNFPVAARGSVRDWILFRLEGVPMFDPWPNFNIADACLVAGAVLVLIRVLWGWSGVGPVPREPVAGAGDGL